jgi:RloB-like protein
MAKGKQNDRIYSSRKVNTRQLKERFLIVCEGTKTEPNYFRSFRVPKDVVDIRGLGKNPSKLVEAAKNLSQKDSYDQVWCVFDHDSWTPEDFNNAIKQARDNGFRIAYSNEAFELWYILHFEFLNTAVSRKNYEGKLTALLKRSYEKNSEDIYDLLLARQDNAIKHAEKLLASYDPVIPAHDNPSTTVHLLVKELNRFVR